MRSTLLLLALVAPLLAGCSDLRFDTLFLTPDQRGERLFRAGEYDAAAATFRDPLWKATALYSAERFGEALDQLALVNSADSRFLRGNALAHLERYEEASEAYGRVLEMSPDHPGATANIEYLEPFQPLELEGGVMGTVGRDAAADDVTFDADADRIAEEGRDTDVRDARLLTDAQLGEMWLRQVNSSPAAFLRNKFRTQAAAEAGQ